MMIVKTLQIQSLLNMPEEMVEVEIHWSEQISYCSRVKMTKSSYQSFVEKWNNDDEEDSDIEKFLATANQTVQSSSRNSLEIFDFDLIDPES